MSQDHSNIHHIPIGPLIKTSWSHFSAQPMAHVVSFLILIALSCISAGILFGPLLVGYILMIERQNNGEPIEIEHLFSGMSQFIPAFLATLIIAICVILTSGLIVLPGIILAIMWMYTLFIIALDTCLSIDAMKQSWTLVRLHPRSSILFVVSITAANIIGLLTVIGFVITGPTSIIFMTEACKMVRHAPPDHEPASEGASS